MAGDAMIWLFMAVGILMIVASIVGIGQYAAVLFAGGVMAIGLAAILDALRRMNTTLDAMAILLSSLTQDRKTGGEQGSD